MYRINRMNELALHLSFPLDKSLTAFKRWFRSLLRTKLCDILNSPNTVTEVNPHPHFKCPTYRRLSNNCVNVLSQTDKSVGPSPPPTPVSLFYSSFFYHLVAVETLVKSVSFARCTMGPILSMFSIVVCFLFIYYGPCFSFITAPSGINLNKRFLCSRMIAVLSSHLKLIF